MEQKTFLLSKRDVLGYVAKNAVMQSPYHRPENLEVVLDSLDKILEPHFKKDELGFIKMTYKEIKEFISQTTQAIPEFCAWNERKNGNKAPHAFVSRYSQPEPDNDFIDLDALYRNVANDIVRDKEAVPIPEIIGTPKVK